MNQQDQEKLKKLLEKEQATIEGELERVAVKNTQVKGDYKAKFPDTADSSDANDDRAREIEEWERNRAIEQELEIRLKDITEIIRKLETNEYGLCSNCQNPIEEARLKAMPTISICVNCARKATFA